MMNHAPMNRRDLLSVTGALATLPLAGCAPNAPRAPARDAPPRRSPEAPSASPGARDQAKSAAPKSILILGGTGFLGPELVEAAEARGHRITLFNRGKTRPQLFPNVEKLRGDRDGDLKSLEGHSWDAVIDPSGYVPRIVKASAELLAPRVKHYVFISTISVFEDTSKPGMDERAPVASLPEPGSEDVKKYYGALKALCEKAAEAAMPGRVANVRPGLIVGPNDPSDRFTYWPVRVQDGGEVLAPGSGSDPIQIIDVRDLAAWVIRGIEQGEVGVFDATGPDKELTMGALLAACKSESHSDATFTWADAHFLAEQKVEPWSDMPVWVPAEGDSFGFARLDVRKAIGRGLSFRPVAETVCDTLAWWKTLPEERRSKLRAGLSRAREAEVLAAWKKPPRGARGGSP
jgi:2'-hydroxyisoflavone reductase